MSRTYTRAELRTRLEQLCDIENDSHLSTTEKNEILNSAVAETWDAICDAGLGENYVTSTTFTTTSGTQEYTIGTTPNISDYYRMHGLFVVESNGQLRALQRIQPTEVLNYQAPPTSGITLKLYYIPSATKFGSGDDAVTFNGINGWEEHTLMTAACAVKMKREEDYSVFYRRKKELEERIKSMGNVDFGEPARVSRKKLARSVNRGLFSTQNVNAYILRGNKIELLYLNGYLGGY